MHIYETKHTNTQRLVNKNTHTYTFTHNAHTQAQMLKQSSKEAQYIFKSHTYDFNEYKKIRTHLQTHLRTHKHTITFGRTGVNFETLFMAR